MEGDPDERETLTLTRHNSFLPTLNFFHKRESLTNDHTLLFVLWGKRGKMGDMQERLYVKSWTLNMNANIELCAICNMEEGDVRNCNVCL
jgi:hypothetical protein